MSKLDWGKFAKNKLAQFLDFSSNKDLDAVNGQEAFDELAFIDANTIYVDLNGSDTTGTGSRHKPVASLTGAKAIIDGGTLGIPSSTNPIAIRVAAGNYSQQPVDFSSYTNINIFGASLRTRINASDPNSDLLTMGVDSGLRSISLAGVTNASNWHVVVSGSVGGGFSTNDLAIVFGSNGLKTVNASGTLRASCFNSLSIGLTGTIFESNVNSVLSITTFNAVGDLVNTIGIKQNSSSELFVFNARLTAMSKAIQVNGSDGFLLLSGLSAPSSAMVLDQLGSSKIEIIGGNLDIRTSTITDLSVIDGYYLQETPDEFQFRVISELSVGSAIRGAESAMGEGDSYTLGMKVFTYDGSSYVDVSTDAALNGGTTFTFPNTNDGTAIYLGTAISISSPVKFYGFKMSSVTAASLGGGDIVFEYWNGSSWVEFNHFIAESNAPHQPFAASKFEQAGSFQVRFNSLLENDWQTNDPVGLGANIFWVRFRIDSGITTAPVFDQFKVHTNRMEINANGFQEMFGLGRIKEKFPISFSGFAGVVGRSPSNQDVYLSDNLAVSLTKNSFPANQARSIIFNQFIPYELDTSCPLNLTLSYFGDDSSAGGVVFRVRWATSSSGDSIYTQSSQSPPSSPNERVLVEGVSFLANEENSKKTLTINLEIPEAISQVVNGDPESQVWILIERVTNDSQDTYSGSVILTDLALFYTAWREGGYTGVFS